MGAAILALWNSFRAMVQFAGDCLVLGTEAFLWNRRAPRMIPSILLQFNVCTFKALPVVGIFGAFTGMVLTLQMGNALSDFQQEDLIGGVVAVALAREMGPMMTAMILAGLVGSAMAAEIGTMKVSEEIDALEVMGIPPIRYLATPRIFGLSFACPLLTIYNDILGFLLGGVVGFTQLSVDWDIYKSAALRFADNQDVYSGLFKAWVFGVTIAIISCTQGLRARGGALGVGRATRSAVVKSFLVIIIFNYFLSSFFSRYLY